MNFAICLYGYTGYSNGRKGYGDKLDPEICYNHIRKHILEKNSKTYIFIHTWEDKKTTKRLKKIFKPSKIVHENQKFFGFEDEIKKLNDNNSIYKSDKFSFFNNMSAYYSLLSSLDLARKFEDKKKLNLKIF